MAPRALPLLLLTKGMTCSMSNEKNALSKEDKKLVNELFWNSFFLENCYNYERQQGLGFAVAMWPAIKRFYKTKEDRAEALTRHMAIFNTTPHVVGAITGVAAALESEASQNPEFDKSIINNVKVGLMGPFAGIGDSFFQGTLRIIASGIGISLCQQGSILGPLLFLLIFNVPHIIIRYLLTLVGYRSGTSLVEGARGGALLHKLSKGATIVGLMVIGGMSASMIALGTPLAVTLGETTFEMQLYLDQIFPSLLPLLYVLLMFGCLKKGMKSTGILLLTIGIALLGAFAGVLA